MKIKYTYYNIKPLIKGYTEGDYFNNLIKVLKHLDPEKEYCFDNWDIAEIAEDIIDKCACSHDIKNGCYIKHKITGAMLLVGNVCVKKFSKEHKAKIEKAMRVNIGLNKGNKYCNHCKRKVSMHVVNMFNNVDTYYHLGCLKLLFPVCPICDNYKVYNCICNPCSDCGIKCKDKLCKSCYIKKYPKCKICFNLETECICVSCHICNKRTSPKYNDLCYDCGVIVRIEKAQEIYLHYKKKISDIYNTLAPTNLMYTLIVKYKSEDKYNCHNFIGTSIIDEKTFGILRKLNKNIKRKFPNTYSPVYKKDGESKYITFRTSRYNYNFKTDGIYKLNVKSFKKKKLDNTEYVVFDIVNRPHLVAEPEVGLEINLLEN